MGYGILWLTVVATIRYIGGLGLPGRKMAAGAWDGLVVE